MVFSIFLMIVMLVVTIFAFILVFFWFTSIVGSGAPFVPVPMKAMPGIVDALQLKKDSVVYDMGCGDGRILLAALEKEPAIRTVGVERAVLPYVLARWKLRKTRAEVIHGDFFDTDLTPATHVVLYLFPELMQKVEKKLMEELKPGTLVLAVDFTFKDRTPTRVVTQDIPGLKRGVQLSLYEFS